MLDLDFFMKIKMAIFVRIFCDFLDLLSCRLYRIELVMYINMDYIE